MLTGDTVGVDAFLAVGLSYRRLDNWTRRGWLRALNPGVGSGRVRHWPASELEVARTMLVLTGAGVDPSAAARAARDGGRLAPGVTVTVDPAR